jgi:hypothetical protein
MSKIFHVLLAYDDRHDVHLMDAIEHEDKLWLVPGWLLHHSQEFEIPARIICLSSLRHDKISGRPGVDYLLPRASTQSQQNAGSS